MHKQILNVRNKLSELEDKRAKMDPNQEGEFWQAFIDLNLELDQYEQTLNRVNHETALDVNQLRDQIIEGLTQYNHWRKQMRAMEISFMTNILRPGYVLKQALRQKAYLDKEYTRIRTEIVAGEYSSIQELEAEIRRVLMHGEHAYEADERGFKDEYDQEKALFELAKVVDAETFVEDENEEQILQNFKRIVLPAIHPDTSETSQETFLTVFEAYSTDDFLLMEAYVAQYRGSIDIDEQEDPLKVQEALTSYQQDYHRLAGRLDRKLKSLQKELTAEELEDPTKVEKHLIEQREELRRLIQQETQIIFDLREKIEGLIQFYFDVQKGKTNG